MFDITAKINDKMYNLSCKIVCFCFLPFFAYAEKEEGGGRDKKNKISKIHLSIPTGHSTRIFCVFAFSHAQCTFKCLIFGIFQNHLQKYMFYRVFALTEEN